MTPVQLAFCIALIVLLVGMAVYYAWQQICTLRLLRTMEEIPTEERTYLRRQAYRRLVGSILMVLIAGMFIGAVRLEETANEVVAKGEEAKQRGEVVEYSAADKKFLDSYRWYWIICLLALLSLLGMAGLDLIAIWKYGLRNYQKIQSDRRAMIEGQLSKLRSQRNGHH